MRLDVLYVSVGQRFGPEQVAINLLENLLESEKLTIFGVVDNGLAKALSSKRRRDAFKVPKNSISMFFTLFVILLKNKVRVCHFNFPPLLWTPLLFLIKIKGIKIVYSFHGGILFENKRKWLKLLFIIQCKYFYDVIVANSEYSAQFLLQAESRLKKKLIIIPNGIRLKNKLSPTNTLLKGTPALLCVGRIDYIKGVDILVKAIALVKARLPAICLHIVGDGTKLLEIKALISQLRLEKNVLLHGFISRERKNSLYSASNVVVIPSRNEPFGIVVLEAMRAGKPLIVSDRGALPELVKNNYNGLVTKLRPDSLAKAILNLTTNKELMDTISENNKNSVTAYDWKTIANDYLKLYRTLIDEQINYSVTN